MDLWSRSIKLKTSIGGNRYEGVFAGTLDKTLAFLEAASSAVTAVLPHEEGGMVLRLNELAGKDDAVTLRL